MGSQEMRTEWLELCEITSDVKLLTIGDASDLIAPTRDADAYIWRRRVRYDSKLVYTSVWRAVVVNVMLYKSL